MICNEASLANSNKTKLRYFVHWLFFNNATVFCSLLHKLVSVCLKSSWFFFFFAVSIGELFSNHFSFLLYLKHMFSCQFTLLVQLFEEANSQNLVTKK